MVTVQPSSQVQEVGLCFICCALADARTVHEKDSKEIVHLVVDSVVNHFM